MWITTRHEPARRLVEFTRFTPESRVCVLRIAARPNGANRSFVDVAYTYTAVSPAGNAYLERFTEAAFLDAVTFWERSMNHWLATGERLSKA